MEKIKISNVTKIFGKNSAGALKLVEQHQSKEEILKKTGATVGVYEANLMIKEGEIFVIMGLSGSGKSTLIRLLNRLIEPTSGDIFIDGKNIMKMNKKSLQVVRREKMSMVFQNFALFPQRTILENAQYGLEIRGVPKEERRLKAEKALQNAGLLAYKDQYPSQLSGGMQQRVGLARALANDTEIILMDEAFSALDPLIRKEMQDELLELQANLQKTIVFITHDLNEALRIGDRIAIMKDGKIMQIGTGEEILTNPSNDYVRTFIEDVDRSKVLTAENAMVRAMTVNIEHDGPKVALQRMREEEVSVLLAVDKYRQYQGYITADDALQLLNKGEKTLKSIIKNDMPIVKSDTVLQEILSIISDSPTPIAVVDEGKLRGVLIRGVVLEALASTTQGVTRMNKWLDNIPEIPVAENVERFMDGVTDTFAGAFKLIQNSGTSLMGTVTDLLVAIPPILFIAIVVIISFIATRKIFGLALFSLIGLLFIYNQGLWEELMNTFTLVLFSSFIAILLGVPIGILMAKSKVTEEIIKPILDFMQTMPGFVYLIPAVAFFGIGVVPGVFASVIFALPPTVRFTNLGIRQVPKELIEASDSYGSTTSQKLFKVELPLAKSTIMAGINQTVLLSLSMVVIASMIGAPGLGREVLSALQRAQVGNGFVAGISLVIFAIIVDRLTQSFNKKNVN